ncbi:MAG: cobalamin-dependent protein [Candidatus Staskawiczbacteria bacterium]|nr:cobalamin-dependent protein [Candidatus Staskawiczbacteria bacterium]
MLEKKKVRLCRLVRPANPMGRVNIYSQFTRRTTNFGLVMLATVINKLWGWRVEVIDEENYHHPGLRDDDGLPDHEALQRENPADVVGFYCGLTSTIERVWELAAFYKSQGLITLGGSWHAHYLPEETLNHSIDLVVHGDAELQILKVLGNIENNCPLHEGVGGVSYLKDKEVGHVLPSLQDAGQISDCDERLVLLENRLTSEQLSELPYPDFGLLKHARIVIYPIGRIRGCSMGCKYCTVKGGVRWASAEWFVGMIDWLVSTRKAKTFFIVDDRSEEDLPGTLSAFDMIADKYARRLKFNVQMRLGAAKNLVLMESMRRAGVRSVCIGLESPIEEELRAMKKGIVAKVMLSLLKVWRRYMKVHGMFIFGFPASGHETPIAERVGIYKKFIKKACLDFIQVLLPIPLPGSELYNEYKTAGKLFPLSVAGWNKYDGNFLLIKPDKKANLHELQSANLRIMKWFYSPFSFYKMVYRTLIFPVDCFLRGFGPWKSDWGREVILWIGHGIVKSWLQTRESEKHLEELEKHI